MVVGHCLATERCIPVGMQEERPQAVAFFTATIIYSCLSSLQSPTARIHHRLCLWSRPMIAWWYVHNRTCYPHLLLASPWEVAIATVGCHIWRANDARVENTPSIRGTDGINAVPTIEGNK